MSYNQRKASIKLGEHGGKCAPISSRISDAVSKHLKGATPLFFPCNPHTSEVRRMPQLSPLFPLEWLTASSSLLLFPLFPGK